MVIISCKLDVVARASECLRKLNSYFLKEYEFVVNNSICFSSGI